MEQTKFEQGTALLRQWYREEIQNLTKEALEQPLEEREDWIHDRIDSHGFVIYTHLAQAVILSSRNHDALENETGELGTDEQRAYHAMCADIREEIERMSRSC